jgi:hypothetical protein
MATILIAGLSFVVDAVAAGVALLAFAAWSTRDLKEVEGNLLLADLMLPKKRISASGVRRFGSAAPCRMAVHPWRSMIQLRECASSWGAFELMHSRP